MTTCGNSQKQQRLHSCFAGIMSQEAAFVGASFQSVHTKFTDWRTTKHTTRLGNPLLQVHPSNSSQAHGNIDPHCTTLRTESCPTWLVFLSIGGPPLSGSNTGIPWQRRHSTFTRTRKQTPRRNRRILRPRVNIASRIFELTTGSHVTVPRIPD